jgi:aminopeptidase N
MSLILRGPAVAALVLLLGVQVVHTQRGTPVPPEVAARLAVLRGEYGRLRANNDLLTYDLRVRVDPERRHLQGRNIIRFRMLNDDTRIQIDLYASLSADRILFKGKPIKFERELNSVFIDFPETLRKGQTHEIEFHYSGVPQEQGRFGGIAFRKDPQGRHWINTACEGEGSSIWWPSKDQWRDEPESMKLGVEVPNGLTDVSNGRFTGKTDLGDGYTRWDWQINYPINSYNVSLNIGTYEHFGEKHGSLTLDYWVLPENIEKARAQFTQVKPMIEAFEHYFGEYPFPKDGFKLIEVPYTGMEHQSAVTYGSGYRNGYGGRDWTGVGVSPKFDFIIIHESAHEWFGNAVSAADVSDMWIQEGWTTYLECLYVERVFGYDDALRYTNGYRTKIANKQPVITERGLHRTPSQDMYFKGALFLHTLRSVFNDDAKWWRTIRGYYDSSKYRNVMTEEMVAYFNKASGMNLTPVFNQYLRRAPLPVLELQRDAAAGVVRYRWNAEEPGFAMPIKAGKRGAWEVLKPTAEWQSLKWAGALDTFEVATDLYYVVVRDVPVPGAPRGQT